MNGIKRKLKLTRSRGLSSLITWNKASFRRVIDRSHVSITWLLLCARDLRA